ncbi:MULTISPECIES: MFS transporter [Brevibacterium]|uniref:MFS transporter n=1 Tax=Brevibacterium salitolerans TaxID=1403566 RepID=A0ABN2WI99_9MICO|nr:MFS transporter [Brevibacterium sp.]
MRAQRRAQAALITAQLFSGAGIASGYAVGGLLAEQISGRTSMAGFAQMSVILGAGLLAYPLAALAGRKGRRTALTLGFGIGTAGALVVLAGVALQLLPVFLLGMLMCGSSTASGLQARYAAVDLADPAATGRAMSLVVWATTVGSVLGPSFTDPGAHLGEALGMHPLAGPYLISMAAFALAMLCASLVPRIGGARGSAAAGAQRTGGGDGTASAPAAQLPLGPALRVAAARPAALLAIATVIAGQMMMTNVMVMTPVHMDHQEFELTAIGVVVSLHIAGMYALSPVFGWMADRWGQGTVLLVGALVFALTIGLGVYDALAPVSSMGLLTTALVLLGIGWSMFLIGGSSLLTSSVPPEAKLTLQGASDSAMNLGGALMAAMAGTVLELGGFLWINLMATAVLVVWLLFFLPALRRLRWPGRP